MFPSDEKKLKRGVFDVQAGHKRSRLGRLLEGICGTRVINLRPKLRIRHPWLVFGGAIAAVLALVVGAGQLFTRAEVADFFPAACLGEWEGSENAQGVPDTFGVVRAVFDESNSAIYPTPLVATGTDENANTPFSSAQIFCGGFVPTDYEARGDIESAGITFVWQVGPPAGSLRPSGSEASEADLSVEALDDKQATSSTMGDGVVGDNEIKPPSGGGEITTTQTDEEPLPSEPASIPEESPENSNSTTTSFLSSDYWFALKFWNVDKALAEEVSSTDPRSEEVIVEEVNNPTEPEETGTGEPSADSETLQQQNVVNNITTDTGTEDAPEVASEDNSTTTIIIAPPITASLEPLGTSTENIGDEQATSSEASQAIISEPEVVEEIPVLDKDFLQAAYSINGRDWIVLANVNKDNWRNLTVSLPINNWEDLRNIQIKIEGIQTTLEEIPQVYLDGILVEVHYSSQPILDGVIGISAIDGEDPVDSTIVPEEQTVIVLPPEHGLVPVNRDGSFKADEGPVFDLDLDILPSPVLELSTSTSQPQDSVNSEGALNSRDHNSSRLSWFGFFLKTIGFDRKARAQTIPPDPNLPTVSNPIVTKIFDPDGVETNLKPFTLIINNKLRISLPQPGRAFKPGKYKLQVWIWKNVGSTSSPRGVIYFAESDFNWGVLAVNFNKSIYTLDDEAKIGFAVLDNRGHTICDADVEMTIRWPSGRTEIFKTLPSASGNPLIGANVKANIRQGVSGDLPSIGETSRVIERNSTCGPETVTNEPDYSAIINEVNEVGSYGVSVVARTRAGLRQIKDKFSAEDPPTFDVERLGPTRIFPPANYKFTIRVKANVDFDGTIAEIVPRGFSVFTPTFIPITDSGDETILTWQVNLKAGDVKDLVYFFKAPDISPELYKLGPLTFVRGTPLNNANTGLSGANIVFKELRSWQIAADAAGDVILLWEAASSSSVPAGWTCLSCVATDPFFGVFPRASSTYGSASSSQDTMAHTASFISETTGAGDANTGNVGSVLSRDTHVHGFTTTTIDAVDIRPPFLNLLFISANTTTIPSGAIGMFDVASSSLPADWSYFAEIENNHLRGETASSTGGAATHSHGINLTSDATDLGAATTGGGPKNLIGGSTHTHVISSSTDSGASNAPPFVEVVFGQTTATTTLGSGSEGLIAIFDNTSLPTNWGIVSTSGSPYADRFLKGAQTFGATGGSTSTHTHANETITSGVPSATDNEKNQGAESFPFAGDSHTHDFAFSFASSSSLPTFRYVILGKFTAPTGNNAPTVSNVVLNDGSLITLNPNVTTTIIAKASTTDPEGPGDISSATGTIYRSGVGASCSSDNLNCYQASGTDCVFKDSTSTVECTVPVWYFAQSTDGASSSFPPDDWQADITVTDSASATDTSSTSPGVELSILLAINITTSSINYGTVDPGNDTGSTNETTTVENAGNSSSTLNLDGTALTSGVNELATSSQHYATSSFTFGGDEQLLQETATAVSGYLLTSPTSTARVSSPIFWGIGIATGSLSGTYSGTSTFTAVFEP